MLNNGLVASVCGRGLSALVLAGCVASGLVGCASSAPSWAVATSTPALDHWRDHGTWVEAGDAMLHPERDDRLAWEPGTSVLVNGPDGRTVDLATVEEYGDVEIDLQFLVASGSNSGVYVMGRYEIQVLDSYGKDEVMFSDCGGIYQRWDPSREGGAGFEGRSPRVNASLPAGTWQRMRIVFRAPRFDASGTKIADAVFERVELNGQIVQENEVVTGPTRAAMFNDEQPRGPLMVQGDHGPVAYRAVRIRPLGDS